MIYLVCPNIQQLPSGGTIYNKNITNVKDFHIIRCEVDNVIEILDLIPEKETVLVDSIFLIEFFRNNFQKRYKTIGLIHLPVFMNCAKNDFEIREFEISCYKKIPLIVTGISLKKIFVNNCALNPNKIFVIEPGMIDSSKKINFSKLPRKLVMVSSISPIKRIFEIILILKKLKKYPWELCIYGNVLDDKYFKFLLGTIDDEGLKGRVKFMKITPQKQLFKELRSYDLFLHYSRFESYGMAIYEALELNLPVLCLDNGLSDNFKEYENSLFIENEALFFEKFEELLQQSTVYSKLCFSTSRKLRKWNSVVSEFREVLNKIN